MKIEEVAQLVREAKLLDPDLYVSDGITQAWQRAIDKALPDVVFEDVRDGMCRALEVDGRITLPLIVNHTKDLRAERFRRYKQQNPFNPGHGLSPEEYHRRYKAWFQAGFARPNEAQAIGSGQAATRVLPSATEVEAR